MRPNAFCETASASSSEAASIIDAAAKNRQTLKSSYSGNGFAAQQTVPNVQGTGPMFHTGLPSQKERRLLIAKQSAARARAEVVGSGTAAEAATSGATMP